MALPGGFSVEAVGGLRGQVRDPDLLVPIENFQPVSTSELISREHYVMWEPEAVGPYLRIGRFYAPYGLRMAEHILYINRDLGFDELEETYNVSGGFVYPKAELHLTVFAPDFVRHIGSDEKGFAAYLETRFHDDTVALAAQMRLAISPGVTKMMGGVVGKGYIGAPATRSCSARSTWSTTSTPTSTTTRAPRSSAPPASLFSPSPA